MSTVSDARRRPEDFISLEGFAADAEPFVSLSEPGDQSESDDGRSRQHGADAAELASLLAELEGLYPNACTDETI